MMTVETNLRLAGVLLILLGLAHLFFNRYLGWNTETAKLNVLTRQVFYVHCFFIVLVLFMMGAVSIFYAGELLKPSPLSRALLLSLALFWLVRLVVQWFVYDVRIWRGSPLFTTAHWLFSLLWIYLAGTYSLAWKAGSSS